MNYYKKINLVCLDVLKDYVFNYINNYSLQGTDDEMIASKIIRLPNDLLSIVNTELNSHGISDINYCRIYLWPRNSVQFPHIDGRGKVLHCAINIPLKGGEKSIFQWFNGDFEIESIDFPETNQKAYEVKWLSKVKIAESIEIKDGCYLVRIDQPHQAIASADSDRWLLTIRFKGNPTFEELYDRLPASNI